MTRTTTDTPPLLLTIAGLILLLPPSLAAEPTLNDLPFHGSPVRGYSDDVVFINGDGFVGTPTVRVGLPGDNPATLTDEATILTVRDDSVSVTLPANVNGLDTKDPTRAIWVRNGGESAWTGPLLLNDPRPLWISPSHVLSSGTRHNLPREVRVVGRNLHHLDRVKYVGSSNTYELAIGVGLNCSTINLTDAQLEAEIVEVSLPLQASMTPDTYTVHVKRVCGGWIEVADNALVVEAVPSTPTRYVIENYGGKNQCDPDDGVDDTFCVLDAIADAKAAGGELYFGAGTWDLDVAFDTQCPTGCTDMTEEDGILVPTDVDLVGAGPGSTTIRIGDQSNWDAASVFTLLGSNHVSGIHFHGVGTENAIEQEFAITWPPTTNLAMPIRHPNCIDSQTNGDGEFFWDGYPVRSALRLGLRPQDVSTDNPVEDVSIVDNRFSSSVIGILGGGFSLSRVTIVDNDIQAFQDGIRLQGGFDTHLDALGVLFRLDDAVIVDNVFNDSPFSGEIEWESTCSATQYPDDRGVIGAQIGASNRVRISQNLLDGCADDPGAGCSAIEGFRAGIFFSMGGSHEKLLLSENDFIETGRKSGDGEAIAIDVNRNRAMLVEGSNVSSATSTSVTIDTDTYPLVDEDAVRDDVYREHWLQVGRGQGLGQTRRISSYSYEETAGEITEITLTVSPAFEVIPDATSYVTVHRQAWQAYLFDNHVVAQEDGSTDCDPGVDLEEAQEVTVGTLHFYSTTSDSLIANNTLDCVNGIWLAADYGTANPGNQRLIYNTAVLGNSIDRDPKSAFDDTSVFPEPSGTGSCNGDTKRPQYAHIRGGIGTTIHVTESTIPDEAPALVYGVAISDNSVTDSVFGVNPCGSTEAGAIAVDILGQVPSLATFVQGMTIWDNAIDLSDSYESYLYNGASRNTFDYIRTVVVETHCDDRSDQFDATVVCNDDSLTTVPSGATQPVVVNEDHETVDCAGDPLRYECPCDENYDCLPGEACRHSTDECEIGCSDDTDCDPGDTCVKDFGEALGVCI